MENIFLDAWFWVPVAFWAGWKLGQLWQLISFREVLKDLGVKQSDLEQLHKKLDQQLDQPSEESAKSELPVLEVKIEQHQGILFAFRKDNDQFLGQGPDREKLIENLTHNLTNVRVVVSKEDGGDLLLQERNT